MKRKVILTCAVTGENRYNRQHPSFPITPEQIAAAALEAEAAGATTVHLHVRNPETGDGSRDPVLFKELAQRVRAGGLRSILNITCGGGAKYVPSADNDAVAGEGTDVGSVENRTRHIRENRPEVCSLDVTTQNQMDGGEEYVYLHSQSTLRRMAKTFLEHGVKPEIEIFAPGDLLFANQMVSEGLFAPPPFYQMVLGTRWGLPADVETILYLKRLLPPEAMWAAFGIGRQQMPMVAQSVLLGGHARVGLEDNLYLDRGVFATNGQLVERAVRIIRDLGCEVATPDEGREILGLKR
ncbi:3-keto-5-aminohexanoate cleavage protein [Steroidobacter sp.]|uniref:3-keto-5-aminohexanoate cleavage protein n=1 Tax=Steroidobacter sp. TaxID=1978227 RepID=UPI001A5B320F|nr:3-keto-5-aminohexanoate cleavage protein [Steroidobacter sp.]MBL8266293.1 3-keto-5-aminohexanoate cleavage protein [Steroidobacter sp.]